MSQTDVGFIVPDAATRQVVPFDCGVFAPELVARPDDMHAILTITNEELQRAITSS